MDDAGDVNLTTNDARALCEVFEVCCGYHLADFWVNIADMIDECQGTDVAVAKVLIAAGKGDRVPPRLREAVNRDR